MRTDRAIWNVDKLLRRRYNRAVQKDPSNFLHDLLQRQDTSLRRLARRTGISPSTLSRWASGKQTPSPESCRRFADALSLPAEEVLALAGHLPPEQRTKGGFDEDMRAMIKDLIPECYPSPFVGQL
ncbi:MAG: helix-turn-helix transcriptional regulator [Chloroflexi bacterium]|nr:helix-turn-helix transcriptional regulator [Chloroflexota bacterium]